MFTINWYITLAVVVLTPLSFFVASFIAKHAHKNYVKQAKYRGEITGFAAEMIEGADIVTAFNGEEDAYRHFHEINEKLKKVGTTAHFYAALTNPCTRFVNAMIYAVVAVLGSILTVKGGISVGKLSSFLTSAHSTQSRSTKYQALLLNFRMHLQAPNVYSSFLTAMMNRRTRAQRSLKPKTARLNLTMFRFHTAKTSRLSRGLI